MMNPIFQFQLRGEKRPHSFGFCFSSNFHFPGMVDAYTFFNVRTLLLRLLLSWNSPIDNSWSSFPSFLSVCLLSNAGFDRIVLSTVEYQVSHDEQGTIFTFSPHRPSETKADHMLAGWRQVDPWCPSGLSDNPVSKNQKQARKGGV